MDTYLRATVVVGQESSLITDYVLKVRLLVELVRYD